MTEDANSTSYCIVLRALCGDECGSRVSSHHPRIVNDGSLALSTVSRMYRGLSLRTLCTLLYNKPGMYGVDVFRCMPEETGSEPPMDAHASGSCDSVPGDPRGVRGRDSRATGNGSASTTSSDEEPGDHLGHLQASVFWPRFITSTALIDGQLSSSLSAYRIRGLLYRVLPLVFIHPESVTHAVPSQQCAALISSSPSWRSFFLPSQVSCWHS